jgi:hypothetical protein
MKKQAIMIQCHANPEIINQLIDYLPNECFDFYIHVDSKSNIDKNILRKSNVFFAERVNVKWGTFSQVDATLKLLEAIKVPQMYSYIHLISGNDFIIKSEEYILNMLDGDDRQYIGNTRLPGSCTWSWNGRDRYSVWYPQWIIRRPTNQFFRFIRVVYREFIMHTKIFTRRNKPVEIFWGGLLGFHLQVSVLYG